MEAIALLLTAVAKIDGDLSHEEKKQLQQIFQSTFKLSEKDAIALLRSSSFVLGDGEEVYKRPDQVLALSADKFSDEQKESSVQLLHKIANVGAPPSETQQEFVQQVVSILSTKPDQNPWH